MPGPGNNLSKYGARALRRLNTEKKSSRDREMSAYLERREFHLYLSASSAEAD